MSEKRALADKPPDEIWLQGHPVAAGIAIGMPFFLKESQLFQEETSAQYDVKKEIEKFRAALSLNQAELQELYQKLLSFGCIQEAELVESNLLLATDPLLTDMIESKIRGEGKKAVQSLDEVREELQELFCDLDEPLLCRRYEDIKGICDRLATLVSSGKSGEFPGKISTDAVLCAQSVSAPMAAQVSINGIGAIVTTCGGAMSHTAIIAKSKGIPYVVGIDVASVKGISPHEPVIVDGVAGIVILRPHEETLRKYMELKVAHGKSACEIFDLAHTSGTTQDGHHIRLLANVAKEGDIYQVSQYGLDGVGLYRTEYQILEKCRIPSEEEQFEIYSAMVRASKGRCLVIRVFDFGSDKGWEKVVEQIPEEARYKRALSLLLACPDLFRTQLRAILRASRLGPISLLFPMVCSLDELQLSLNIVREVFELVALEGALQFPRIGAMLEIPSILFHLEEIARLVDFISLGTNDLIQYAFAVDRSNTASFDYRIAFHPGLMHLISYVVKESRAKNIPLCLCGEMASDPLLVPFLVGLGVRELSLAPRLATGARKILAFYTVKEMEEIASRVLRAHSAQEIYIVLRSYYATVGYEN